MKLSSPDFNVMYKACRKAAKNIIRNFGEIENLQVSLKGPGDFVTASDKKAEKIIIEELQNSKAPDPILMMPQLRTSRIRLESIPSN